MKPVVVLSNVEHQCATFVWPQDLHYFVGYRFVEHSPTLTSTPLTHPSRSGITPPPVPDTQFQRADDWLDNWQTTYANPDNELNLRFQMFADGSALASVVENDGLQECIWRFVPEETGVRIWMTLTTHESISGSYIVQQYLRFTSGIGFGFGASPCPTAPLNFGDAENVSTTDIYTKLLFVSAFKPSVVTIRFDDEFAQITDGTRRV